MDIPWSARCRGCIFADNISGPQVGEKNLMEMNLWIKTRENQPPKYRASRHRLTQLGQERDV